MTVYIGDSVIYNCNIGDSILSNVIILRLKINSIL